MTAGGAGTATESGKSIVWRGEVTLREDVVVPRGATLRIEPGAVVGGAPGGPAEPLVVRRLCFGDRTILTQEGRQHIIVFGAIEAGGDLDDSIGFDGASLGGILLLGSSRASLRGARFCGFRRAAVQAVDFSSASVIGCSFSENETGVALGGASSARLRGCRVSSHRRAGLLLHDDARARAAGCLFEGNRVAIEARGTAALALRGGRVAGSAQRGLEAASGAEVSSAGGAWAGNGCAVSAAGRAAVRSLRDRFEDNEIAILASGRAELHVERASAGRNGTVVWSQESSRCDVVSGRWESNRVGVKSSQRSRVRVEATAFVGHSLSGLFVEDESSAEVSRGSFVDNENGILVRDRSRLSAAGCEFTGCRDTAVWRGGGCRVAVEGGRFERNLRDSLRA